MKIERATTVIIADAVRIAITRDSGVPRIAIAEIPFPVLTSRTR